MFRDGRGVDNRFVPRHRLFYRCKKEDIEGDRLIASRISYQNKSVNWCKYSKAWDVIFDYPRQGIAQFMVRHLPKELPRERPDEKAKTYTFAPSHVPVDENYSHSEIWTFKAGERFPKGTLPDIAKKEFRTILSDRSVILWPPDV